MATVKRLHFHGRLITAEEVAGAQNANVAVTAADGFWTLMRRHVGKSQTGYSKGTAATPEEIGSIALDMLSQANIESPTGVRDGDHENAGSSYVEKWFYKKIGEGIAELGATLDGPEWMVRPIEWQAPGYYGALDLKPALGEISPEAAFEYGDGLHNVKEYRRLASLEQAANRVFHLPPGFPDNASQAVLMKQDPDSIVGGGLLEDVLTVDLSPDELRTKLLEHHIAVRAGGRQTITFSPAQHAGGRWTYIITDLRGVEMAELAGAGGKTLALPIGSMATASFTLPLDHEWSDFILAACTNPAAGGALLKVYEEHDDAEAQRDLPTFGVHYERGDIVPFRASAYKAGELEKRIDVWTRLHQVQMAIDANGIGTPTLTLVPT